MQYFKNIRHGIFIFRSEVSLKVHCMFLMSCSFDFICLNSQAFYLFKSGRPMAPRWPSGLKRAPLVFTASPAHRLDSNPTLGTPQCEKLSQLVCRSGFLMALWFSPTFLNRTPRYKGKNFVRDVKHGYPTQFIRKLHFFLHFYH